MNKETKISDLLTFYMGKNTPDRQLFIIDNLKIEKDIVHEDPVAKEEVKEEETEAA